MTIPSIPLDYTYILNFAARYLARDAGTARHDYGQFNTGDPRAQYCEGWRFPLVDSVRDPATGATGTLNRVTFVYPAPQSSWTGSVSVVGSFLPGFRPVALQQVQFDDEPTRYWAASVDLPVGEVHFYHFLIDGERQLDPVNPQQVTLDNGRPWSRFFTQFCAHRLSLERWEQQILNRLTEHILPFRTSSGQQFLNNFFSDLSERRAAPYQIDEPVGVVNFIDNLLAKEERHFLDDYKTCLGIIDGLLRQRHPGIPGDLIPRETYVNLYLGLAAGNVDGWDFNRYQNPAYFLQLLRRHTYTGAFSHPKYGGNAGAVGWRFLEETYRGPNGESCFDWSRAIEAPLGRNQDYRG